MKFYSSIITLGICMNFLAKFSKSEVNSKPIDLDSHDDTNGFHSSNTRRATMRPNYYRTDRTPFYENVTLENAERVASSVVSETIKDASNEPIGLLMSDGSVYKFMTPNINVFTMNFEDEYEEFLQAEAEFFEEYYSQFLMDPSFIAVISYDYRIDTPSGIIEFVNPFEEMQNTFDFMTLSTSDIDIISSGRELRVSDIKKIPSNELIVDNLIENFPSDAVLALVPPPPEFEPEVRSLYKVKPTCNRPGGCGNPIPLPFKVKGPKIPQYPKKSPKQYIKSGYKRDKYGRKKAVYEKVYYPKKSPYYLTPEFKYIKPSCPHCKYSKQKNYPKDVKYVKPSKKYQKEKAYEYARKHMYD